jgi:hypothetical protein
MAYYREQINLTLTVIIGVECVVAYLMWSNGNWFYEHFAAVWAAFLVAGFLIREAGALVNSAGVEDIGGGIVFLGIFIFFVIAGFSVIGWFVLLWASHQGGGPVHYRP